MPKSKTAYVCRECGADFSKWHGQCPECGNWNSVQEIKLGSGSKKKGSSQGYAGAVPEIKTLASIDLSPQSRLTTGMSEFDRVLGGGLVSGSAVLIGGHPGAGKSTLLLQMLCYLAQNHEALYVTGEESLQQVAMRAERLGLAAENLKLFSETRIESIEQMVAEQKPTILVVDSIQVMFTDGIESAPGSVSQVRECAAALTRLAKQTGLILCLVGHVTKEGSIAGPKVLEHMIDCSIMLEGSTDSRYRTLRGIKNRFGAVNELGVFAMMDKGLVEVKNPSAIFLTRGDENMPGSIVTVLWEGTRPLLVELQALVDESAASYPKRVAIGLDQNRLAMLLAILNRHGSLHVGDQDVFINLVGGVKTTETSTDLASMAAIISSFRGRPIPEDWVIFGEVGLSGEVRPVPSGQERVIEAAKHGFKRAIVPKGNRLREDVSGVNVEYVGKLTELIDLLP